MLHAPETYMIPPPTTEAQYCWRNTIMPTASRPWYPYQAVLELLEREVPAAMALENVYTGETNEDDDDEERW